ncbi:MAG: hypothetical protein ACK551_06205 [Vampirovibrionales bacterium]
MMKLAPMNAYPLPEGSRVKPSTLRTGQLLFHNELIEVHDDEAFLKAWREISTFFPKRKDLLALLVAGWHDIVNVNIYQVAKDRHVMEVEGFIREHGYHHKLESNLQREQLIEKIISAYNPLNIIFPRILDTEIGPIVDQYFDRQ